MEVKSQLELIIALSNGCKKNQDTRGSFKLVGRGVKARRIYLSNISAVLNIA